MSNLTEIREFVRDIAENYDHDTDVHKYDTTCRKCAAVALLDTLEEQPKEQGVSQELIEAGNRLADQLENDTRNYYSVGREVRMAIVNAWRNARAKALPNSTGTMPEGMVEIRESLYEAQKRIEDMVSSLDSGISEDELWDTHSEIEDAINRLSSLPWPEQGKRLTDEEIERIKIRLRCSLESEIKIDPVAVDKYIHGYGRGLEYARDHGYLTPKEQMKEP